MRRVLIFFLYFYVILYAETTISVDSLFSMGNRYFNIEKYDYALDAYLAILDQVEHLWTDHKKLMIGVIVVIILLAIA